MKDANNLIQDGGEGSQKLPFIQSIFILRRPRVANLTDIIKIATIYIKTTFIASSKVTKIRNYLLKCNLYLCFLIKERMLISDKKTDVSRTQVVYQVIYMLFGSSLGKV